MTIDTETRLCACGCGSGTAVNRRYVPGHQHRPKPRPFPVERLLAFTHTGSLKALDRLLGHTTSTAVHEKLRGGLTETTARRWAAILGHTIDDIWPDTTRPPTANVDWMDRAACRGHNPALWFPENFWDDTTEAKDICAACPARTECLEYALTLGPNQLGILAGLTENQRDRIRRQRQTA